MDSFSYKAGKLTGQVLTISGLLWLLGFSFTTTATRINKSYSLKSNRKTKIKNNNKIIFRNKIKFKTPTMEILPPYENGIIKHTKPQSIDDIADSIYPEGINKHKDWYPNTFSSYNEKKWYKTANSVINNNPKFEVFRPYLKEFAADAYAESNFNQNEITSTSKEYSVGYHQLPGKKDKYYNDYKQYNDKKNYNPLNPKTSVYIIMNYVKKHLKKTNKQINSYNVQLALRAHNYKKVLYNSKTAKGIESGKLYVFGATELYKNMQKYLINVNKRS